MVAVVAFYVRTSAFCGGLWWLAWCPTTARIYIFSATASTSFQYPTYPTENMPPTSTTTTTTARAPKTADERVNFLLSDYDRVTKSLESAKRQLRLHKITYACSIAIVCLDCWFSFNVLNGAGGLCRWRSRSLCSSLQRSGK